jgi:ribonuclease HI
MKYKGFFDGSAKPNPGIMTIGGVIKDDSGTIECEYSKELGKGTNNEAEYISLMRLIKLALENDIQSITIYGDSALVVNQVNRAWKAKDDRMRACRDQVLKMLVGIKEWRLEHVKRGFNKEADALTR